MVWLHYKLDSFAKEGMFCFIKIFPILCLLLCLLIGMRITIIAYASLFNNERERTNLSLKHQCIN